ncbi:MAG: hypothetical protein RR182_01020 [Alistipes sp.]
MKLLAQNFNIAYGSKGNGLTVNADADFFNLDETTQINVIAGNCFEDWDDEDTEEFDSIHEIIQNFIDNNFEDQPISMWFE